ncbi:hypothetical protein AC579_1161 [Pseudocercospora musae]|uniref:Uncharacterized protein n=1 Tax=Pseudocercospora musae TaxID=113226 RepID=A0A139I2Y3_9PEZI|nr:hypothetical protein AC579_1161 [Pseudocercospora musae]
MQALTAKISYHALMLSRGKSQLHSTNREMREFYIPSPPLQPGRLTYIHLTMVYHRSPIPSLIRIRRIRAWIFLQVSQSSYHLWDGLFRLAMILTEVVEPMKNWSWYDVEEFVTASIAAFSESGQADENTLVATKGQLLLDIVASISEDEISAIVPSAGPDSTVPDELDFGTPHPQSTQPTKAIPPSMKTKIEGIKPQRKRGTASVDSDGSRLLELKGPIKYKKDGRKPRDPISLLPVGITILKDVVITAKEICTFCPESLAIPEATMRMMRNRVKPEALATWQLEAVGKADDEKEFGKRFGVIKHQKVVAGSTMSGRPKNAS